MSARALDFSHSFIGPRDSKKSMSARAFDFSHSLGPRDSKKSKFSHLEIYLVVLEELTGL